MKGRRFYKGIIESYTTEIYFIASSPSADPEGGGGGGDRGSKPPPGKSQVIWVSIGNKQLGLPPPY